MFRSFLFVAFLAVTAVSFSQKNPRQPKLVIGIVVDQMRADFVYRFDPYYVDEGFRRFLSKGFDCRNTNYNYLPTITGPGHAAIYTGSIPAYNGIIANDWFDRGWGKMRYVVSDPTVQPVGTEASTGKMSPRSLLASTVTDELRLSNNKQSKVVGVCIKDRGSVLPAGHLPTASYWFDNKTGNMVTSSYYTQDLPQWVKDFNGRKIPDLYLSKPWQTLLPLEKYNLGLANGSAYRKPFAKEADNKFPHDLPKLKGEEGYELLRKTPFGNSYTLDFAFEAIKNEQLGTDDITDFLALSFSSTDYVGHQFGINSIEIQDTYARLDKDLKRLFEYIDKNIGMENVLIFLTADHGAGQTPDYLMANGIPSGFLPEKGLKEKLNKVVSDKFGQDDWIQDYGNEQVYLNLQTILEKKSDKAAVIETLRSYLKEQPGVQGVYDISDAQNLHSNANEIRNRLYNGIHPNRSGEIAIILQPSWFEGEYAAHAGTTHGSGWSYDTHVPLLWLGWQIKNGSSSAPVSISDIAATVSDLLHIARPNACIGTPISDMILR